MRENFVLSILNIISLCIIISIVSIFFITNTRWVGIILVLLSFVCILSLTLFKIKIKTIQPDFIFGIIDNGILAIFAIFGSHIAGVAGAILGGVVGNAITDGIAGIFEGYSAEKLRLQSISEKRTMLKSAVGKMAGCLFGAGIVLEISNLLKF